MRRNKVEGITTWFELSMIVASKGLKYFVMKSPKPDETLYHVFSGLLDSCTLVALSISSIE